MNHILQSLTSQNQHNGPQSGPDLNEAHRKAGSQVIKKEQSPRIPRTSLPETQRESRVRLAPLWSSPGSPSWPSAQLPCLRSSHICLPCRQISCDPEVARECQPAPPFVQGGMLSTSPTSHLQTTRWALGELKTLHQRFPPMVASTQALRAWEVPAQALRRPGIWEISAIPSTSKVRPNFLFLPDTKLTWISSKNLDLGSEEEGATRAWSGI